MPRNKTEDIYQEKYGLEDLIGNYSYTPALQELNEKWGGWKEDYLNKYLPMIITIITIIIAVLTILFTLKAFTGTGIAEGSSILNINFFP